MNDASVISENIAAYLMKRSPFFVQISTETDPLTQFIEALLATAPMVNDTVDSSRLRTLLRTISQRWIQGGSGFHELKLLDDVLQHVFIEPLTRIELESFASTLDHAQQLRMLQWTHTLSITLTQYLLAEKERVINDRNMKLEVNVAELAKKTTELKQASIEQQQMLEMLQEVWVPIAPIHQQMVVVPLIGTLDTRRSKELLDRLTEYVAERQIEIVITDISGVQVIDTAIANHIIHMGHVLKLLGCQLILVGITPEIAQTIVSLGVDLSTLITLADLQAGFQHALMLRGEVIQRLLLKRTTLGPLN